MAVSKHTNTQNEEWRSVPGYEGYEVSNLGRVKSLDRIVTDKAGIKRQYRGRMLTLTAGRGGYLQVNLKRLGRGKTLRVHRLVLEAFVGPRPSGQVCCHNDGNPANNRLTNLRWDSPSGNQFDSVRHHTHYESAKTHCTRGHKLVAPNLVLSKMKRGQRNCRACHRAHAYIQYRPGMTHDLQQISDSYYSSIMD